VPIATVDDPVTAVRLLTDAGVSCWAAVPLGGIPPTEVPSDGPVALILGNEPHGLDAEVVEACTGLITVPTVGGVDSLNVAVAGSVALHALATGPGEVDGDSG